MAATAPPTAPPLPKLGDPPKPPAVDEGVVQLGQLFHVLGNDPKYRGEVLGLIKKAAPHVPIPELDLQAGLNQRVDQTATTLREENKKLVERLDRVEGGIKQRAWMEANGIDEEEYAEVVKVATEKKIGDPDTALDYFRRAELGRPRGTANPGAAMSAESRKELYRDPKGWAIREGNRILAESRRRRSA